MKQQGNDIYLGDAIDTDKDGNPLTIEEVISDNRNLAEDLETKTQWEQGAKIIENIKDEREREIIILRYGLNNKKAADTARDCRAAKNQPFVCIKNRKKGFKRY